MPPSNDAPEIEIPPDTGWESFDGTIKIENRGPSTIFVTIYEGLCQYEPN